MIKNTLPVALIQEKNHGDAEANLAVIEARVAEAAQRGARLVLLQELHNGAYFCQHESVEEFDLAEAIPGPSTERLGELAKQHGVVLVSSLFERRAAGLYHNTAVVFEKDGSVLGKYRKMHIPDDPGFYEKFYFTPGDIGFKPIDTSVGRLGVLVCWDQWYPEAARLMALAGAELLLYPTAIGWDPSDEQDEKNRQRDAWILSHRGHAVANGLPVLSCNRVGHEASPLASEKAAGGSGIQFWGNSHVLGPQGEFIAEAGGDAGILSAEIDLARSEHVRRIWPFLRDRRIDAYGDLLKRYID
ncbi:MAG: carbon-nitrogen hydrolase [Pseudoxanthomonas sp.]